MLELNRLAQPVIEMGQVVARQERDRVQWVAQARAWLDEFADRGGALHDAARRFEAAVPTAERFDLTVPCPSLPERFTVAGADGAHIPPDHHAAAMYAVINVGSLVYRHGSGQTPQARSDPQFLFRPSELYEGSSLLAGELLDARRDRAEIERLADLVEAEPDGPVLALVDGSLLLWGADRLPADLRPTRIEAYLAQLERIRRRGAAVAAYTARPRAGDLGRLLHLASLGGDVQRARGEPNPFDRLADAELLAGLSPGARSALFVSSRETNERHYRPQGHAIHFFYVNVSGDGEEAEIARVELPAWVAASPESTRFVHAAIVAQSRIVGGFPYVLARADELAYISAPERQRLEEMIGAALLAAGSLSGPSFKALYKSMTRRTRR